MRSRNLDKLVRERKNKVKMPGEDGSCRGKENHYPRIEAYV